MDTAIPRLYATPPQPLSFAPTVVVRSFLLQRNDGNLLIYGASTVETEEGSLRAAGGVSRQYLNHSHEASPSCDWVARTFNAPLHCHELERADVSQSCNVDETFTERHTVDSDFEVIPIVGHTGGATAYLWDSGHHRCLFTGDTIMLHAAGEWIAAVLPSSDRNAYIASLELIRELDFDVLVPWATDIDQEFVALTGRDDSRRRIDDLLKQVRAGGTV